METTARSKNGNTSSQHTWDCKTTITQNYYKQQNEAQQNSQSYNYEQWHQQSKMVNDMFASALI